MRELGVRRILGPCAAGALQADLALGEFVVCDQFVDRTSRPGRHVLRRRRASRSRTCRPPTRTARSCASCSSVPHAELGIAVRDGGTVVVIQGPRFSTRAESAWFSGLGWHVVNMTAYPECHLARELELCYANVSMVTDHDAGVPGTDSGLGRGGHARVPREPRAAARAALRGPARGSRPSRPSICARRLFAARSSRPAADRPDGRRIVRPVGVDGPAGAVMGRL